MPDERADGRAFVKQRRRVKPEGEAHLRPNDALAREVTTMKGEIDALQISLAESSRPWWKQASTWISVIALLVTGVTASLQVELMRQQSDIQVQQREISADAELTNIMTQVGAAQQARTEAIATLESNSPALSAALSRHNSQLIAWAYKASEIIDKNPGEASAAEYLLVGNLFTAEFGGGSDVQIRYMREAINRARDYWTLHSAARELGSALYLRGQNGAAEMVFRRAVDPGSPYMDELAETPAWRILAFTKLIWAAWLRTTGDCTQWRAQVADARSLLQRVKTDEVNPFDVTPEEKLLTGEREAGCRAD